MARAEQLLTVRNFCLDFAKVKTIPIATRGEASGRVSTVQMQATTSRFEDCKTAYQLRWPDVDINLGNPCILHRRQRISNVFEIRLSAAQISLQHTCSEFLDQVT